MIVISERDSSRGRLCVVKKYRSFHMSSLPSFFLLSDVFPVAWLFDANSLCLIFYVAIHFVF